MGDRVFYTILTIVGLAVIGVSFFTAVLIQAASEVHSEFSNAEVDSEQGTVGKLMPIMLR